MLSMILISSASLKGSSTIYRLFLISRRLHYTLSVSTASLLIICSYRCMLYSTISLLIICRLNCMFLHKFHYTFLFLMCICIRSSLVHRLHLILYDDAPAQTAWLYWYISDMKSSGSSSTSKRTYTSLVEAIRSSKMSPLILTPKANVTFT